MICVLVIIITWNGIDLYNSSASGKYTFSSKVSTSVTVDFQGNAQLSAGEAVKYGLQVTATGTRTSEISAGHEINCPAWTKVMKHPYIYFYKAYIFIKMNTVEHINITKTSHLQKCP